MKLLLATLSCGILFSNASPQRANAASPIPRPSSQPLQDFETEYLYPFLWERKYAGLPGWKFDTEVRDTGPFLGGKYYGTHPAVRIHYSPEVVDWLENDRLGPLPDGAMIIKEMYSPPAAIYSEIRNTPYFQEHPEEYQKLLSKMITHGWTVMIKDRKGDSKDGWFWSGPGVKGAHGNIDDYSGVAVSGFGSGTCIRCHASAKSENTFADKDNFDPEGVPIRFKVDTSWRTEANLSKVLPILKNFPGIPEVERENLLSQLVLPATQRPWTPSALADFAGYLNSHSPDSDSVVKSLAAADALGEPNQQFIESFEGLEEISQSLSDTEVKNFSFPTEFADHVYPGPKPEEYFTSSNCYGCHGGLGGGTPGVSQFISTGPEYGDGYNISPYGEWRWSPMGLAGRDPIFHSQIETEMIILLDENKQLHDGRPAEGTARTLQQALVDTCLRCHGAMGLRQKGLDDNKDPSILNPGFNIDNFYLERPLTKAAEKNPSFIPPPNQPFPPQKLDYHNDWKYGALAREGISCAVCHNIAPPDKTKAGNWAAMIRKQHPDWLGSPKDVVWTDSFFYFTGINNSGLYERAPNNQLYGPFADVKPKPMQNALGLTPLSPDAMDGEKVPFTRDSAMCGTCHTINLPNIGDPRIPGDKGFHPVLTALEPNQHLRELPDGRLINHSIEQSTYLEWLNSKFGPGKDNRKGPSFQSCQDCHMPNRFATVDNNAAPEIKPLAAQIATIQDSNFPEADHALPPDEIDIKIRPGYQRHELVGLNGFMIEMFKQFPGILGVDTSDNESGAKNGAEFAIENMVLSAKEGRVASVAVTAAKLDSKEGTLVVGVNVANKTGHRFPSGVAFRRVWVELLVFDKSGNVIWGSGQTNSAGLIIDNRGNPLPTELLTGGTVAVEGKDFDHQPNYQKITSDMQVQIYEELTKNAAKEFTTSFVHRVEHIKDNRLLPEGWVPGAEFAGQTNISGLGNQGELLKEFMEATDPDGVEGDPDFAASPSTGADNLSYEIKLDGDAKLNGQVPATVQATIYSQAFMPAWFQQRFALANKAKAKGYNTPATDRLYYIASHLKLDGTPMEDWKFKVTTSDQQPIASQ